MRAEQVIRRVRLRAEQVIMVCGLATFFFGLALAIQTPPDTFNPAPLPFGFAGVIITMCGYALDRDRDAAQ